MGRASRRKRANGGPGFFRREHLLAAVTPRADAPRKADVQKGGKADQPETPQAEQAEQQVASEAELEGTRARV